MLEVRVKLVQEASMGAETLMMQIIIRVGAAQPISALAELHSFIGFWLPAVAVVLVMIFISMVQEMAITEGAGDTRERMDLHMGVKRLDWVELKLQEGLPELGALMVL